MEINGRMFNKFQVIAFKFHMTISSTLMKYFSPVCFNIMIISLVLFSACTPVKKLIYLQDSQADDPNYENQVVKSIPFRPYQYRLKPNDRLLLNIFSLTDEKFNFLKSPQLEVKLDDS